MIALKCFIQGFHTFDDSIYKWYCGYYVSSILYQNNNRDSAIFYINRVEKNLTNDKIMMEQIKKLKKRIRWEYISKFEGLPDESISDIEFDGDDIWIAMWTGGVGRFTRSSKILTIFNMKDGLLSPHTRCLQALKNIIYVGTYDGLFYYNKKNGKWYREEGELGNVTIKRIKLIDDKLYVATLGKGLFISDLTNISWKNIFNYSLNITDILNVNKNIYISTLDKGVFLYNGKNFDIILPNVSAKSLCYVNNKLWIGTHGNGIFIIDNNNISKLEGLSSDYIEVLEFISNKIIIGTLGNGVDILNLNTKEIRNINILEGLPSNDVVKIIFEKNRIWFGTLSGGIGILITDNFEDI